MVDIKLTIAKNIADLRKDNGYTQLELAEKLNYSDKAISKWERGESVPDIAVLKEIADLFGVTLDYLVQEEHAKLPEFKQALRRRIRNHGFITGISILLVWLAATVAFVVSDIVMGDIKLHWLSFVYAAPASMIVWLVFNSIWFNRHRNFLIISLLMWSVLAAVFLSLLPFGQILWQIFVLGAPGQIIILLWSRIKYKQNKAE
ncbi:MAG: helix-turn-helix domain-containing protein [Clostridia bacterium]|nr:helix-turn-helix domain-containing protein [Clostridia bacterium]